MVALGYPGAKISLKEDDAPTLFSVAMLMPPIRRTLTTTVHLGSKRAVSAGTGDVGFQIFKRLPTSGEIKKTCFIKSNTEQ